MLQEVDSEFRAKLLQKSPVFLLLYFVFLLKCFTFEQLFDEKQQKNLIFEAYFASICFLAQVNNFTYSHNLQVLMGSIDKYWRVEN